jgi:hypothetical protein
MNGYERAIRTLRFEPADGVATWGGWIVSAGFFEHFTGKPFWENPRAVAFEAYRKLEVSMVLELLYLPAGREEWREHTDETLSAQQKFRSAEHVVDYVDSLPDPESLEKEFDFDRELDSTRREYLSFQEELGSDVFCLARGKCSRFLWYVDFGYENYLEAVVLYPEKMRRLFDYGAEKARLLNMVRAELVRAKTIPPFFFTGHDICGARGPLISPNAMRDLYYPGLRRSLEPLVEVGAEIIWHCDGYIIPVLDDLIACGVSGFQGFQEETGFDIREIAGRRVRNGRKPILLAGLSVASVLPLGSVAEVEKEVERIIDTAAPGGGLAIGTANTAGPDCPDENLEALYRHANRYGRGKSL